jgi:hypothetical protein
MVFPAGPDDRVLIGPDFAVSAGVARLWMKGERPLKMDDDRRSWQEAVIHDEASLTAEARVIYSMVEDLNEYLVPMENGQLDAEGAASLEELIQTMTGVLRELAKRSLRLQKEATR